MLVESGRKWSLRLLVSAVIILLVFLIELMDRSQKDFLRDSLQSETRDELSIIRAQLESTILSDIFVVSSLSTLVPIQSELDNELWNQLARRTIRKSRHVEIVALAPDDIIRYIYPVTGNERALGLDYRTVPEQLQSINRARELKQIFISGPVNLVQGGRALLVRIPIFSDAPANTQYWGVCTVAINIESLFVDIGLERFKFKYEVAIRGRDSTGLKGEVFYGKASTFDNAFATELVHFPHGGWQIAVAEKTDLLEQVPWYRADLVRILGYLILAILLASLMTIYRLYSLANERALHDELTELPNRRYFMFTVNRFFSSAQKSMGKQSFAIMNLDLDKFKQVNDNYGHEAGDKVLVAVADRVRGVLRDSDVIARIGGDEFLILLPRVSNANQLESITIKLEKAICNNPIIYKSHLIDIRVSIGYAMYKSELTDVDEMIRIADQRMYNDKKSRNQLRFSL